MKANREEIQKVLTRIDLVANELSHAIEIKLESSKAIISSSSPEFGEGEEILDIEYDGEEMVISFNARYLLDFVNTADSDEVIFKLKNQQSAGLFAEADSDRFRYIVSPIKI